MDAVTQPKLFISYAHADGESTVKDFWTILREFLKMPERQDVFSSLCKGPLASKCG